MIWTYHDHRPKILVQVLELLDAITRPQQINTVEGREARDEWSRYSPQTKVRLVPVNEENITQKQSGQNV